MKRRSSGGRREPRPGEALPDEALSRRRIFRGAVGAAAIGAASGAALTKAAWSSGATGSNGQHVVLTAKMGTATVQGAMAPAVVVLNDAATIAVDASMGNDFRVTIAGNRSVGTPANPVDGQKITIQVTQGTGGPYTLAWGSGYEFSTSLPQPTLSTTSGQTDLVGFIYNASKGQWLCAAFVSGFAFTAVTAPPTPSATPTVTPTPTPTPTPTQTPTGGENYRLFPATNGPASPVSYSGPFIAGVVTGITSGGTWLTGFWWWVCASGQSTSAQKFTLWSLSGAANATPVAGSTVTSGPLTAGQWNYVPLASPVALAPGATYVAATGFSGSFPITENQFGSGQPLANGIVSGPLVGYSDGSGSRPSPFKNAQAVFSTAGTDPTMVAPVYGSNTSNFWLDMQVTTTPPAGASYRMWPGYPAIPGNLNSETLGYTIATEVKLTQAAALNKIWFYSASGAGALPTRTGIWNVATGAEVPGASDTSPAWSGTAGSGWVSAPYSGVTLPPGDYRVAVYYGGGKQWYLATVGYWGASGIGASGITAGPISAPSQAAASGPGQSTYTVGAWSYPQTYTTSGDGECYWVDIEVTPAS